MVNTQPLTKHPAQAVGYLLRKCNLRHKIQHLLTLLQLLVDEVDIHLGLATRGHTMEQTHIPRLPHRPYLIESPPLMHTQGRQACRGHLLARRRHQTGRFHHIVFNDTLGDKPIENSRTHTTLLEQHTAWQLPPVYIVRLLAPSQLN